MNKRIAKKIEKRRDTIKKGFFARQISAKIFYYKLVRACNYNPYSNIGFEKKYEYIRYKNFIPKKLRKRDIDMNVLHNLEGSSICR